MNMPARSLPAFAALLALSACADETKKNDKNLPAPPRNEPRREELLKEPSDDVRKDKAPHTAADFPGLKITTIKAGEGDDTVEYGETILVHLVGKLATGKQFKSTRESGPEELAMIDGGALRGLVFGCLGMKKGEVRSLMIPADLAYGEDGDQMAMIPPNATVIMRAELVESGVGPDADFLIRRMKKGTGEPIRVGQAGKFHYTGILAEGDRAGVQFDSSRVPGREAQSVTVGQGMIDGWNKGLVGMKVGEQRWLKIPPHLAYRDQAKGDSIPPNSTLIFEVELISVGG